MAKRKRKESGTGDAVKRTRVKTSKAPHFPFLRFPAELRNVVYDYVFGSTHYKFYNSRCRMATHNINLLLVSRQLHTECALLPYKLSTFSFGFTAPIRRFLEARTKQQLRAIEDMRVFGTFGGTSRATGSYWFKYLGCEKKRCSDRYLFFLSMWREREY
ncbi:hypothetical protein AA0113_g6727 [Alternaria arborescens]|uniref:F-box domain-containing protein n=3 Tax=Alternaria sect. Alternaria TaxID=2499237 RepID=A0A4Q4MW96_ALTAL|nr:hypothetical protein AA0112_g12034 [Alternaria arborescens]RYN61304.1 hypothetical protein AA0117_g13020 [Alternaria alternata]RYN87298.1 hypothetical protein AA0119_g12515 [Alternaria tenuissima]RYO04332.1 hypothetical protein AA0121_g12858 [Alternaria tenuissima]RYO61650.1 hypothetical protein AA0113_g6727 [Alternaria arborescens]